MRTPDQVAHSWLDKADIETDSFDRFVSLWFALNALYNEFFDGDEPQAIRSLVYERRPSLAPAQIRSIVETPSARFFTTRIIRDMRGRRNTQEDAGELAASAWSPQKRLKALLMILYRVRCNLFHGNKMYLRDSDEEVVSQAATALHSVVRAYLQQ